MRKVAVCATFCVLVFAGHVMAGPGEQAAERTDPGSRGYAGTKTDAGGGTFGAGFSTIPGLRGVGASTVTGQPVAPGAPGAAPTNRGHNAAFMNKALGAIFGANAQSRGSPTGAPGAIPPMTTVPAGPGNATTADESMAAKYNAPPGVYDQATSAYRDRLLDKSNFNNSFLDNLGNMLAGSVGVGEMAPKFSTSNLSPNATWGLDPVQALLSAIGMGFPPAKIAGLGYQGAKMATGWDGPQIAMGDTSESFAGTPGAPAHTTSTTGFTAPGSQTANLGPGAGTGPGGVGATIPSATPTASQPSAAVPVQAAAAPAATANPNQPGQRSPGGTIISGSNTVAWPWSLTNG